MTSQLTPIAAHLWCAEHDLYMPGRVHFRTRMTVVRLDDGSLVLISPVPIDDALARELAALGPVGHIVAPSLLHHVFAPAAAERYPDARVYGAPGLAQKRADISFHETLSDAAPAAWRGQLEPRLIAGAARLNEVVFLHRASGTLIVTDLVFNIHRVNTWMTVVVLRLVARAYRRFAQSRLWRRFTSDRAAAGESVRAVLAWDFERVVMAHGDIIERDARGRLTQALAWMLGDRA